MIGFISFLFRAISKVKRLANVAAAKRDGLKVGEGTILVGDQSFGSEPFLIKIGDNCLITDGVKFITHDGSIQVPLISDGLNVEDVYSKKSTFGRINVGDNVFVGVGSIILPSTNISRNSIVAAGSVVKGSFESGVVIGGNPAKVICSLEEYYSRNADGIVDLSGPECRISLIVNATSVR